MICWSWTRAKPVRRESQLQSLKSDLKKGLGGKSLHLASREVGNRSKETIPRLYPTLIPFPSRSTPNPLVALTERFRAEGESD